MASKCCRIINRATISFFKSNVSSTASINRSLPKPTSSPLRRFSISRSPSELGAVQSLLPLHSAVASARMTSCLSPSSRSCRALSQVVAESVSQVEWLLKLVRKGGSWWFLIRFLFCFFVFISVLVELGLSVPR